MSFREVVIVKKQDNKWQMLFEFFPVEWRPKYDRYYINCDLTKTNLICLYYYQKDAFKDQFITNILLEEIHDAQYFDNIDIAGFLIDNELTLAGNQESSSLFVHLASESTEKTQKVIRYNIHRHKRDSAVDQIEFNDQCGDKNPQISTIGLFDSSFLLYFSCDNQLYVKKIQDEFNVAFSTNYSDIFNADFNSSVQLTITSQKNPQEKVSKIWKINEISKRQKMSLDRRGIMQIQRNFYIDDEKINDDKTYEINIEPSEATNGHIFDWIVTCDDCYK